MIWLQEHARTTIRYDHAHYDFRDWAIGAIGSAALADLHAGAADLAGVRSRSLARMAAAFADLRPLLRTFVERELGPRFGGVISFQDPPIFRVHPHGFGTISPFHKDHHYSPDPSAPLLRRSRNVWIPLTRVFGTNSLWVETAAGSGALEAVELDYGEALVFDATSLTHGSYPNRSGSTRVSFELRVLPAEVIELSAWAGTYARAALRDAMGRFHRGPVVAISPEGGILVDGAPPAAHAYQTAGSRLSFTDGSGRAAEVTFHRIPHEQGSFTNFSGKLWLPSGEELYYSGLDSRAAPAKGSGARA